MPFSVPKHEHPEQGDDRPAELHRAHLADGAELRGLDQPDRVDDDDRRERGVRQQAEERREQQHGRERRTRRDERRLLRPPARGAHDRGLRGAAAGRHRAEQRAPEVGGPGRDQLAVRVDRRIFRPREGAARRDRLGEAHERDPERARREVRDQGGIRQRERRESLRNQADRRDAERLQAEVPGRRIPPPTATSGAGEWGQRRSMPIRTSSVAAGHGERDPRGLGDVAGHAEDVAEEPLLGDVDPEELRHLVEHDHEADAGLEAREHRRGDEVGDEPELHAASPGAASRPRARPAWPSP